MHLVEFKKKKTERWKIRLSSIEELIGTIFLNTL